MFFLMLQLVNEDLCIILIIRIVSLNITKFPTTASYVGSPKCYCKYPPIENSEMIRPLWNFGVYE